MSSFLLASLPSLGGWHGLLSLVAEDGITALLVSGQSEEGLGWLCWKKDLGWLHCHQIQLLEVEFSFGISHCSLVANPMLDLLCELDLFRAVRIASEHLLLLEGGVFPCQDSPAWQFNFMVTHVTLQALRPNGQVLLHNPPQAHGLLLLAKVPVSLLFFQSNVGWQKNCLCATAKGDATCFACVFVTDQCLWFVGCASTLWIGGVIPDWSQGSQNPRFGSGSRKPADVAVCPPSVCCPSPWTDSGLQRLTQPQIEPMSSDSRFPVHPLCCPTHSTTHPHSRFITTHSVSQTSHVRVQDWGVVAILEPVEKLHFQNHDSREVRTFAVVMTKISARIGQLAAHQSTDC